MTSRRIKGDAAGIRFYIGSACVAQCVFVGDGTNSVWLRLLGEDASGPYPMADAMGEMHRRLKEPLPD